MAEPWTSIEWDLLKEHVHDPLYSITLGALLPDRTPSAIAQKMSALRKEAEIVPRRIGAKAESRTTSERRKAEEASTRYTAALLEMVA